jgi:hypothetical protein
LLPTKVHFGGSKCSPAQAFFGGRACGRQQLYGNAQALPLNMFYIAATGGSNYKNIIFSDAALP